MGHGYTPKTAPRPRAKPAPLAVRVSGRARKSQTGYWTPTTHRAQSDAAASPAAPAPSPAQTAAKKRAATALAKAAEAKAQAIRDHAPMGDKTLEKQIAAVLATAQHQPGVLKRHKLDKPESVDLDRLLADLGS